MLTAAKARVAALANHAFPTLEDAGRIAHPDDQFDVLALIRAEPSEPVLILHAPQLAVAGAVSTYTCLVSVCAATENAALAHADSILALLRSRSAIAPTTSLAPIATTLREDGYWRVAVGFTLRLKA